MALAARITSLDSGSMTNNAAPHIPSTCPQCSAPIAEFITKRTQGEANVPDEAWTYRCENGHEGVWESEKPTAS